MKLLFIVVLSLLAVSYAWEKKAEPRTKDRAEDKKQTREQETAAGSHTSKGVRRGKKLLSWRNF